MAFIQEKDILESSVVSMAGVIMVAARTAPKARGIDNLFMMLVTGNEIEILAKKMEELGSVHGVEIFIRDANCIRNAEALVLFGTKVKAFGLKKCGMCGFVNCAEKEKYPRVPCVMNTGDLGIAIGSAVAKAADFHLDNRLMYTLGQAAMELNLMGNDIGIAYGLPLAAKSKNPFFDRT